MSDYLADACPALARRLPRTRLADLPTPVEIRSLQIGGDEHQLAIKRDDLTGELYGGNKVRKLEYLLAKAQSRGARRIATFGTVGSNHALAMALYAHELGYECTCFLSHQAVTPTIARTLRLHLANGTEIIRYGGGRASRIATLRKHLWRRRAFLIPPGGSSWLGAVGFVAAGLELAAQVDAGDIALPDRIYVANGTMGTAVGLALGLALAGASSELHAVQVTEDFVSSPRAMQRLLEKTASMLNRLDPTIPDNLAARARYVFRTGYLGDGYAKSNAATDAAVALALEQLDLPLETTYTGKAMAALIDDLKNGPGNVLFWNTYNSRQLSDPALDAAAEAVLPKAFQLYLE
ncbi:MAG: pyridoxal-phosphate dependent enzyme [Woeseiaceae bacterium]|nr:pyridoxal-phosphate dependent enzyme [Woeseiaceae bacterium]